MPARGVYRLLLGMHPLEFRCRFGPEMLWIYDELPESNRGALMVDGLVSLLRQRLLRSGLWKFAAGVAVNAAILTCFLAALQIFEPHIGR